MSKQSFQVAVTKFVSVEFDTEKLDAEFWGEFNDTITDRGGPDIEYLAEHVAWNFVQGDAQFIEGIGPLANMNVKVSEIDSEVDVISHPTAAQAQ